MSSLKSFFGSAAWLVGAAALMGASPIRPPNPAPVSLPIDCPSDLVRPGTAKCTAYFVTRAIYSQLSFLKPNYVFFDVYAGVRADPSVAHALYVQLGATPFHRLLRSSDFTPLIAKIETPSQALALARFFSDPRVPDHELGRLDDVAFHELGPRTGRLLISDSVLKAAGVKPPRVEEKKLADGEILFVIERFVLTSAQEAKANDRATEIPAITKVTETIMTSGNYSVQKREVPVKGFKVSF